jgi:argininosuccinate lyase
MPHKRNPYALAVLRGGAGTLLGRLTGLLATGLTPSARTDNWLYAYGEVAGAVDLAGRLARLGAAVMAGLCPDTTVLREQADRHFVAGADLAGELSLRCGLDYRTAYRVVGRAVAAAVGRGDQELTVALIRTAAEEVTGRPVPVTDEMLAGTTDPAAAVAARQAPGGASPPCVREHARRVRRRLAAARRWNQTRRAHIAQAEAGLLAAARSLASHPDEP